MDANVITVPMKDFKHDVAAMAKAVRPGTKAVFVANPNNPTGTYNTRAELDAFLTAVKNRAEKNLPLIILDEAYYEYARLEKDYPEMLEKLSLWPNLILLRTFSKIYGLAGLRVGYAFASPEIVSYLERVRPPFNINSVAQAAAEASLKDGAQVLKSGRLVQKEKKYLYEKLNTMKISFIPSAANFILVNVSPSQGMDVFNELLKKGVIVRAMDEYDFPYHIRVTIGLPEENRRFIRALSEVLKLQSGERR
jgi:histidinol-phosphate aminotransferase